MPSLIVALALSPAHGATLQVGPGDSIQSAVDRAAAGDTIEIAGGDYDGNVRIAKDLTLTGDGAGSTTITTVFGDGFDIDGGTVALEGMSFRTGGRAVDVRGGTATLTALEVRGNTVLDRAGAAVRAHPGTSVTIIDSVFAENETTIWSGGHVFAELATVEIRGSVLSAGSAPEGGALWAADSTIVLENTTVEAGSAEFGAGIYIEGCELELYDVSLLDNHTRTTFADPDGGGLFAVDSLVFAEGGVVADNRGGVTGGGMRIEDSDVTLLSVRFEGNSADFGGGLYLDGSETELAECLFIDNEANDGSGGAVRWRQGGGTLTVAGSRFEGNEASESGGAIATIDANDPGELFVQESHFEGNIADDGGAIAADGSAIAELVDNLFCGNDAGVGGGVYLQETEALVAYNDFVHNQADDGGGLYVASSGPLLVAQNDFLGNIAAVGGGMGADDSDIVFHNNVAMANQGHGIEVSTTVGSLDYNAFWDNAPTDFPAALGNVAGPANLFVDPQLTSFTPDGNCDNDDLTPVAGSPLIDAGDPAVTDPDGSPADIGSVVGAAIEPEDNDNDGYETPDDCDDTDATVHPGATEDCSDVDRDCSGDPYDAPVALTYYRDDDDDGFGNPLDTVDACDPPEGYVTSGEDCRDDDPSTFPGAEERCNGLDDDCDGVPDDGITTAWFADADGDGWGAGVALEQCDAPTDYVDRDGDCDDDDGSIHPGADDPAGDGLDTDCDGVDGTSTDPGTGMPTTADAATVDEGFKAGGCGCTTSVPAAPWLMLLLGPLLARRRITQR